MDAQGFFRHFEYADAFDIRGGAGEIFVDQCARQADCFKNLRAGVGHVSRDAHLRHDLAQALADCLDEILDRFFAVKVCAKQAALAHVEQCFHGDIGMDGFGAITT